MNGAVDGAEAHVIPVRRRSFVVLLHLRVLRAFELVKQLRPQHQIKVFTHACNEKTQQNVQDVSNIFTASKLLLERLCLPRHCLGN